MQILDIVNPTTVFYEGYAMGARGNNMFHIGELGGVLKMMMWERGIAVAEVSPTTLKMVIAGSGRAEKKEVMASLAEDYGLTVRQHDEADAAGLMIIGEIKCGTRKAAFTERKRLSAVDAIEIVPGKLQSISARVSSRA